MRNFMIALVTIMALACFGCATKSVDDATLTATVKSKLAADTETSASSINVDSNGGVVTLNGAVSTAAEKSKAEQLAKNTEGVSRVVNNLSVKPGAGETVGNNRDDNVTGADGKAAGAAERAGEKAENAADKAGDKAAEAGRGAGEALSDATILTKIKTQILAAGIVGTDVDVKEGVVTLNGSVENAQEKSQAADIARKTEGVKIVKNMLTVGAAGSKAGKADKKS
jgi:hyperosmotically inducible periplasmic protein